MSNITHNHQRLWLLLGAGCLLWAVMAFTGCGGGGGGGNGQTLRDPIEDSKKNSAVGGTVFLLTTISDRPEDPNGVLDQAYNAELTLTGVKDAGGGPYTATTHSAIRGGYQFESVPPGTYTLTASVVSPQDPTLTLTGTLTGIHARGNIPNLMTNLLLGDPNKTVTFSGAITQNGAPAAQAVVAADVTGYANSYLTGDTEVKSSVILTTNAGADGRYQFTLPKCGQSYYIAASSDTSVVSESQEYTLSDSAVIAGAVTVDLTLDTAQTPTFPTLVLDIFSSSLQVPTAGNSDAALVARIATNRALHGPADRLARLEKLARARTRATRSAGGMVENDVYWYYGNGTTEVGVRGYHVYRGTVSSGPFTLLGSSQDPYAQYFFDNDPALQPSQTVYYTVTSYAANGRTSPPVKPSIAALPLPPITVTGPDSTTPVKRENASLSWEPVIGVNSYVVIIYNVEPRFNSVPVDVRQLTADETSAPVSTLPAGTYWWAVAAYNTSSPIAATAGAFSTFRQLTLTD